MKYFLLLTFCLLCSCSFGQTGKVIVNVQNIKSAKGNIQVCVFRTQEEFSKEIPYKVMCVDKAKVINGKLTVEIPLSYGKYGISVLDDENKNKKMDYNFIGMPLEGFGFSNYEHSGFVRPQIEIFSFSVKSNTVSVNCKITYF